MKARVTPFAPLAAGRLGADTDYAALFGSSRAFAPTRTYSLLASGV